MKKHTGRRFLYFFLFVIGLVVVGSGPIGLAIAVMIGIPVALFAAGEVMTHSGPRDQR